MPTRYGLGRMQKAWNTTEIEAAVTSNAPMHTDEQDIAQLLFRWAHARDYEDWDAPAACFHGDATMHIGWISGSAKDYVVKSREQVRNKAPGAHAKHIVSAPMIEVLGDRTTSICHATLHVRRTVGGVEADIESFMRFFDLLERREGHQPTARAP
jgi:hypothetical protein